MMIWPPAWNSWLDWHWGGYPNSAFKRPRPHYVWEATVTRAEQQELYDAAWLLLKEHNVNSNTTTYALAMKLADRIASLRDAQRKESSLES